MSQARIQDADVKGHADVASDSSLINDTKIYVTANSLNKRLDQAITAGDLSGASANAVTAAATFGTDNVVIRSDGTSRGAQSSGVGLDDSNNITGIAQLTVTQANAGNIQAVTNTISSTNTNGDIILAPNGTGKIQTNNAVLAKTSLNLEDPGAGTNKVVVQAPTLSGDWTLTLPTSAGSSGQYLKTDGSGNTSWVTPATFTPSFVSSTTGSNTPSGSGIYMSMTSNLNSVVLTAGTWMLFGNCFFDQSGTAGYSDFGLIWAGASGGNSASVPALVNTLTGVTLVAPASVGSSNFTQQTDYTGLPSGAHWHFNASVIFITTTQSNTVYLVPFLTATTASAARVYVSVNAMRIA